MTSVLHRSRWLLSLVLYGAATTVYAASLDEAVSEDAVLGVVAEALGAYDIDVTTNLNAREVVRQRIERPRLGRFPDLPQNLLPLTEEILQWEAEFQDAQIGGLALVAGEAGVNQVQPLDVYQWLEADADARLFVTFHVEDLDAIEKLQAVSDAYNFQSLLLTAPTPVAVAGEFYSTAAQRLAIDSRTARRYDSEVTELAYLGERVRRNSNSLFESDGNRGDRRLARNEPAVFLKETLGDEFNQSTIREIIVPGGVALGERARLDITPAALHFANDGFALIDIEGQRWTLPALPVQTLKALFDFVQRSQAIQSDAIVDIDGDGRVRITSALRDTDAGFALLAADTQPFEYVRNLPVTKSVIIDTGVDWTAAATGTALQFATDFEVRFLSADNMRIAQTRVALEYAYDSVTELVMYTDTWGREARRLHENLDYNGLGNSVAVVANYAGWIALFRALDDDEIPFLQGRYAFMKLDKVGRTTPGRY